MTGWILLLLGAVLAAGGVWLAVVVGGSWGYIGMGIGLLASSARLIRNSSLTDITPQTVGRLTLAWR